MNRRLALISLAALIAIPAHARNAATLHFAHTIQVGPKLFPRGEYKMTWTGTGPETQVSFSQGRPPLITLPAKMLEARNDQVTSKTDDGAVVDTLQKDGVPLLIEIRLKHWTFLFNHNPCATQ